MNYHLKVHMENIIYLNVDGNETFGRVSKVMNKMHNMFKIVFKDGYENIFYTDVETGRWIEEDLGFTDLAMKVGRQIKEFIKSPVHVPKLLVWHKESLMNHSFHFGFFCFSKGRFKMYEIYNMNRKYMYTIVDMQNDEWQLLGNVTASTNKIDPSFIDHIIQVLPLYSENFR